MRIKMTFQMFGESIRPLYNSLVVLEAKKSHDIALPLNEIGCQRKTKKKERQPITLHLAFECL